MRYKLSYMRYDERHHKPTINQRITRLFFFTFPVALIILFQRPLAVISQNDNLPSDFTRYCSSDSKASVQDYLKGLSYLSSIKIKDFNLIGNTIFPPETLAGLTLPYKGREITFEELQSLRTKISGYYVNRGYINSGAVIPDQEIKDGIITLQIIEGVLKDIQIHGNLHFQLRYIEDRLRVAAGPPLNINDLQMALQLLQQEPCLKRVKAELKPGMKLGESILDLQIEERSPYQVGLEVSNNISSSVGDLRGELKLMHKNLMGKGDTLSGSVGMAEGLNDLEIAYDTPVTARGTSLKLRFNKSNTTVIEDIFKDLDIKSHSKSYAVTFKHTHQSSLKKAYSWGITAEIRQSQSSLLGAPFSFSPGAEDGCLNETVIRLFHEWISRSQVYVFAVRSTLNVGIDVLDSTVNHSGEDSEFFYFLGQAQWIQRLKFLEAQLAFRTDFQYTDAPVPPLEKFAVGGMNTVRGYQENLLVRDNALVASLELSIPVVTYNQGHGLLQLASFVDFGKSWNSRDNSFAYYSLTAAGIGLKWQIMKDVNLLVYKGFPLRDIDTGSKDNLQEKGVHFCFTAFLF